MKGTPEEAVFRRGFSAGGSRSKAGREYPMLRRPDHEEQEEIPRLKRDCRHGRQPNDVKHAWERTARCASLRHQHNRGRDEKHQNADLADGVLIRRQPVGHEPSADPLILIGDRTRKNVCEEDKRAAYAKRKDPIETSGISGTRSSGPRSVER